jgi:sigma-E factor negative regulatory protein RseC
VIAHSADGLVVDASPKAACQQCDEGRGCGVGLFVRRRQRMVITFNDPSFQNKARYPIGSSVSFAITKSDVSLLALLVYALPLFLALGIAAIASSVWHSEWVAVALFFVALIASIALLKCLLRGRAERFRPRLVS